MSLATERPADRPLAAVSALAGLGAIAVSSCCVLPLALALVGIGTGWLGGLEAFAAYRLPILGLAGVALAVGWVAFFRRRPVASCAADGTCAAAPRRWVSGVLLIVASMIFALGAVLPSIENDVLGVLLRWQ